MSGNAGREWGLSQWSSRVPGLWVVWVPGCLRWDKGAPVPSGWQSRDWASASNPHGVVGAALPGLIRDLHTSIAAARDVAEGPGVIPAPAARAHRPSRLVGPTYNHPLRETPATVSS